MHIRRAIGAIVTALLLMPVVIAGEPAGDQGPQLGEAHTQTMQIGVVVTANSGPCRGIWATTPFPIEWPEQQVKVVDEEVSPFVRKVGYRTVSGTVRQMLVEIPQLPAGAEAKALITLEITRRTLTAPPSPETLLLPKTRDRQILAYLASSPYIESRSPIIGRLAKEILADKEVLSAWKQVEALYHATRDKVQYQEGPLKGALQALRDGSGDCEDLSSLFIALCRVSKIPARTVWVPGHCYPEFYLEDEQGHGYWIPCQAAGDPQFGSMAEKRPILQKGDNFRVPEKPRERQRYVAEFLKGTGGKPSVQFIRDNVGGN